MSKVTSGQAWKEFSLDLSQKILKVTINTSLDGSKTRHWLCHQAVLLLNAGAKTSQLNEMRLRSIKILSDLPTKAFQTLFPPAYWYSKYTENQESDFLNAVLDNSKSIMRKVREKIVFNYSNIEHKSKHNNLDEIGGNTAMNAPVGVFLLTDKPAPTEQPKFSWWSKSFSWITSWWSGKDSAQSKEAISPVVPETKHEEPEQEEQQQAVSVISEAKADEPVQAPAPTKASWSGVSKFFGNINILSWVGLGSWTKIDGRGNNPDSVNPNPPNNCFCSNTTTP